MIKKMTMGLALIVSSLTFGQVGIGTVTPHASAELELGSANKALFLNRVADPVTQISNPQPGMILYDTNKRCVRAYQGNPAQWSDCLIGGAGAATSLTCGSAAFSPASATQGTPYTGTLTVPYTGGNGGAYTAQAISQNGLTFTLPAGSFAMGSGNLTYSITGTPATGGSTSVNVTVGGASCTGLLLPVSYVAPTNAVGTGSLSGRTCFDVVEVFVSNDCGTLASRTSQKAIFTQTATNTQTYTFTPSGTVSNVRFVYVNTNGQVIQSISGGNAGNSITGAVNATVVYYNNLNTTASGLSRDQALMADIYVVYNDGATNNGTDRQLKLTAKVQDCACCGAMISATEWKGFMCHNLGADYNADPFTPSASIHGGKFQWGYKPADLNVRDGKYLTQAFDQANQGTISGWTTTNVATNSWIDGGTKPANDPCPAGYRVPTRAQWQAVVANNTATNVGTWPASGAARYLNGTRIGQGLFLPAVGSRAEASQALNVGELGYYWSSTLYYASMAGQNVADLMVVRMGNTPYVSNGGNSGADLNSGQAVRCIQE